MTTAAARPCTEYAGRPTPTGYRRPCDARPVVEAYHLGQWKPLCRTHQPLYADCPQRAAR